MERPQIEDERALLAAIVDSSSDAIIGKDLDGVIQSWNPAAERMFGYSADEAIGQFIGLLIPDERADEETLILARIRRGERVEHFETSRVAKDGRRLALSLTISPIRDASGAIVGASKIARDISTRQRAERLLRESEERFRTLADNISQLAWMADVSGSMFWFNRRWFDFTGTTLEEMKGWGWRSVHHPDHVDGVVESFKATIEAGETWEDTFPLRAADGAYHWFLSRASPIRDELGRIVRWFGTNTDITDRMRMEDALRDANERKDDFLATLAHELRNPLAPIQTGIELLRMPLESPTETQRVLDTIDRQTTQLVRLVDDLLDVSRITRGKLELRRERMDLMDAVDPAVEASRPLIDRAGHTLETNVPEGIVLSADATRLTQVLSNLLGNAAKYTPEPGRIALEARRDGSEAEITVSDTGVGLAPEMLDRIFDPFFQVSSAGAAGSAGLGIGLTLVASIVQMHGGSIAARSEGPGRGTTFVVRLPVARGEHASSAPPPVPPEVSTPVCKVLIVDDNRDAADGLGTLMRRMSHEVRVVYDGASALEVAAEVRPDVVFLDLGMPDLDGFAVAHRLRAQPWGRRIMMVALTGWGHASERERTRSAGFDRHLVKPARRAHLEDVLAEAAARRSDATD